MVEKFRVSLLTTIDTPLLTTSSEVKPQNYNLAKYWELILEKKFTNVIDLIN